MPSVSEVLTNARGAVGERFNTMKHWLEPADIAAVAASCKLSEGTVKQIKKGVKWNTDAVALLIQKAEERKAFYEKMAGSPLTDDSGEPILSPSGESSKGSGKEDRPTKKKRPSAA